MPPGNQTAIMHMGGNWVISDAVCSIAITMETYTDIVRRGTNLDRVRPRLPDEIVTSHAGCSSIRRLLSTASGLADCPSIYPVDFSIQRMVSA